MKSVLLLCVLALVCCNSGDRRDTAAPKDYSDKHLEAWSYCKNNGLNQDFYFLVDLSLHSGRNRFFVYDFDQKKIVGQNLVTHGACDALRPNPEKYARAKFSNANDSHCSAKGKYKIGGRDVSGWGIRIKYWLHGLENTNDNARKRVIVLHSWSAVSDSEIYPSHSPLSWGCPAVSDNFMQRLDNLLIDAKKPVLLWIVE